MSLEKGHSSLSPTADFVSAAFTPQFKKFSHDFGTAMAYGLTNAVNVNLGEVKQVELIRDIVDGVRDLRVNVGHHRFRGVTKSVFLHGSRSKVNYTGAPHPCELGDLLFVATLIENGRVVFQRMTINQFKKSKGTRTLSWGVDRVQLHLLDQFPTFWGVGGATNVIPPTRFTMQNLSQCLGSYGLLHPPGSFVFVNAPAVSALVGTGKTLQRAALGPFQASAVNSYFPTIMQLLRAIHDPHRFLWLGPYPYLNFLYAHNVFDFARKYLILGIGEPTYSQFWPFDFESRRMLDGIVGRLRAMLRGAGGGADPALVDLVRSFDLVYPEPEADVVGRGSGDDEPPPEPLGLVDSGGFGIVHAVFRVGEGWDRGE